ncbi:MAG: DinB family protein [Candidatus Heimdallarchaeota archaeon]|nr:DinB family protein [Candidatus Heimdallarchaeota archaeon]
MPSIEYWRNRYNKISQQRNALIQSLNSLDKSWIMTRISSHQWSIDEILRHMLASEIVYIQQSIDPNTPMSNLAVRAQWVGDVFFRLEESHLDLQVIIDEYTLVENRSREIIAGLTDDKLAQRCKAPWGEELSYQQMIEHNLDHELGHLAQIKQILTYHQGLPKFKESWTDQPIPNE